MRFPDGYALKISRFVNLEGDILYGMKSHDYHVFICKHSYHFLKKKIIIFVSN